MQEFESLKKTINDDCYRLAQELAHELSIPYEEFNESVMNAIAKCASNSCDVPFHFNSIWEDYQLTQYACYLVIEDLKFIDIERQKQIKNYFYTKDFEWWNREKQRVHDWKYEPKWKPRYTNEKEIWNTKRWINVWSETDGKWKYLRPVLILKNIWNLCLVVPLTSKGPELDHPAKHLYHKLTSVTFDTHESFVMFSQIKIIDKKRCIRNMKTIDSEEFKLIKNLLRNMYFPEDS